MDVPGGKCPDHWINDYHEADGGRDARGIRPRAGVDILTKEMSGLLCRGGNMTARDDVRNAGLKLDLAKSARDVEMDDFDKLRVNERVPCEHHVHTGGKVIGFRLVDVNKGDIAEPNYRSRLVGREFNMGRDDALYAATLPLEALWLVISHAATHPENGPERIVMAYDVRRADAYVKIQRDAYIE